jgi:hypothetical protein
MSQRPQPVSKRPATKQGASKHRRNTAAGRHRRITAEMQRRAELNKRRATLVKCVASVGAVAALAGGVSTAATSTLASPGAGAGPESAAKQNPARVPARSSFATGPASRSLTRTFTGISGGALGGVGPSTDLVDPAASPMGDGPLPDAVGAVQIEAATLIRPVTARTVAPKTRSATSVPKVTKVVPATAKVTKVDHDGGRFDHEEGVRFVGLRDVGLWLDDLRLGRHDFRRLWWILGLRRLLRLGFRLGHRWRDRDAASDRVVWGSAGAE